MYQVPDSEMGERLRWAVRMAGLEGREHTLTATLAAGWKQRLALGLRGAAPARECSFSMSRLRESIRFRGGSSGS